MFSVLMLFQIIFEINVEEATHSYAKEIRCSGLCKYISSNLITPPDFFLFVFVPSHPITIKSDEVKSFLIKNDY